MTIDKGILISNIYYMLTYAFQQLKQNNYEDIKPEEFDEIHDLFAEILARGISYQLKQGLRKEYILKNESLTTLRGKLDINGTVNHRMRQQHRLACEFDELSENNLFNQIIKSTALILIKSSNVKSEKKNALKKLMLYFTNVDWIDVKCIKWNTLRFDRNCKTYQLLLNICNFIIDGMLMTTEAGKYRMRAFSDEKMNILFEKFVLEYYKRHHPHLNARVSKVDWNVNRDESAMDIMPDMKTDIMLSKGDRTLIIDTKYYGSTMIGHFEKQTMRSAHLYQIYSYVTNQDTSHSGNVDGMLLYAKTQEEIYPDNKIVLKDGNMISFKTLDLNQKFDGIKEQLDKLVE